MHRRFKHVILGKKKMRRSCALWASLAKWHQALTQVPDKSKLLPESGDQLFRAWQGDKLLGAAAAAAVQAHSEIRDPGTATVLVSKALSNQFFAQNATTLIPPEFFALLPVSHQGTEKYFSDRQWGATLEAAVLEIHQSCDESEEAISELAEWLIEKAKGSSQIEMMNSKGKLLNMGGTIESYRVGGPDHFPIHEAVAAWGSIQCVERQFGSKPQVEELAARKVLTKLLEQGNDSVSLDISQTVRVDDCRAPVDVAVGEWHQKTVHNYGLKLKNGESREEWWSRGFQDPKGAFRRALFAPYIFDSIVDSQCWTQHVPEGSLDNSHAALFILLYREANGLEYVVTPVFQGPSFTKAQGLASVELNQQIAKIVGIDKQ